MAGNNIEEMSRRLLDEIEVIARETENFTGRRQYSDRVMLALGQIPRHNFLPPGNEQLAYVNRPQSIGCGQTISQPYIVALMTDLLDLGPQDKVLEIGTGSGFQAAVLSQLAGRVFSLEAVKSLAESAARRLGQLGYDNIQVRHGDGYQGWPKEAPFDAIMVTAAPERIPPKLCEQLKTGGRMIVPVGRQHANQILKVGVKQGDGKVRFRATLPVTFVPMVKNPYTGT